MEVKKSINFISLNIEGNKHLERVIPFLDEHSEADVVALQEVFEDGFQRIQDKTGLHGAYERINYSPTPDGRWAIRGYSIFSKHPIGLKDAQYYLGEKVVNELPKMPGGGKSIQYDGIARRALLVANVDISGYPVRAMTTKFTWTPDGRADFRQFRDMTRIIEILKDFNQFVLMGDFNAPRGGEIYGMLASRYRDCMPQNIESTLDPILHKRGDLKLVVDSVFVTSQYTPRNITIATGLSDHVAIMGTLEYIK